MNNVKCLKAARMIMTIIIAGIVLIGLGGTYCANAESPGVAKHSKQEIIEHIRNSGVSISDPVEFTVNPVANSARGELSRKTQEGAVTMLNNIRYVAGLDPVSFDENYGRYAQAGAFVNMSIGQMTHYPESVTSKPSAMSQADWDLGCRGAGSCNLYRGPSTLTSAVIGWVEDPGTSNTSVLGHRRWCLNPEMGKTGFGFAGGFCAMYCFDSSGTGTQKNIAWPAQNMPIEYFRGGSSVWSITTGHEVDRSKVTVKLVRQKDGKTWTFNAGSSNFFQVNNGAYGQTGCIIFRPGGIDQYEDGDSFKVTISETGYEDVSYNVNFFRAIPMTGIAFEESYVNLDAGDICYPYIYAYPEDSREFIDENLVTYSTSNKAVASVDNEGRIKAVSAGRAIITAYYKGFKATMTVDVKSGEGVDFDTIKDLPAAKISKPKASKKAITVKWKKISKKNKKKIKGIEIQYSLDGFKTIAGTKYAKKTKTSYKIKGLKSRRKYWVRIRTYKNTSEGKHVSDWKTKTVTVK